MFYILMYGFVLLVYMACPLLGKLIIMGLNFFIPDPLPVVDEVIMAIGFLGSLVRSAEFIVEHWKSILVIIIIVIIVAGIIIF